MKKIFLVSLIVLISWHMNAQLIYDEWGNIIPFSLIEQYKAEIEAHEVPLFVIPSMNNDSLCRKYNDGKACHELGSEYAGRIDLQIEPVSLKENGTFIKINEGKLWRFVLQGASVRRIGVDLGFPKLPKGSYITLIAVDTTVNLLQPPIVYHSENLLERHKKRGLYQSYYGNRVILEYFEPDSLKEKENIIIRSITYGFVGFGKQKSSSFN